MRDRRLYLDNAATSFPKPAAVHGAMLDYATRLGTTPGRAQYAESREGGRIIRRCRERIVEFFRADSPDHVVFTLNCTDALNLAIKGIVAHRLRREPGRPVHLIATAMDHNSVLRPLNALAGAAWTCIEAAAEDGGIDPADVESAITPDTALVVCSHASNVTGVIQPIAEIGACCRRRGVPFLADVAQSAGHVPVDVRAMSIDLLAFPGHKGLLGPLGTGGLYIAPGLQELVDPLREGGTGTRSENDVQPGFMPDKYEPGSHNAVGIAGLSEAIAFHLDRGIAASRDHEVRIMSELLEGLRAGGARIQPHADGWTGDGPLSDLTLYGPADPERRVGVFSFNHRAIEPGELAAILEMKHDILVRAGLHCAPRAHRTIGTLAGPSPTGAVRASLGPFIEVFDVHRLLDALGQICRRFRSAETPQTPGVLA